MFRKWLQTFADVRPGELVPVALMSTYGFLALTAYYIIKPVRNSIFVARVGADQLPLVYILTAVVVIGVMVVYSRYVDRLGRLTLLLGSLGGLAAVLVGFWWILRGGSGFVSSGAFYIFGKLFPLFLVSQFWLVANLLFTTSQARRLFGPIGAGLILGGIAGSTISGVGADVVGTTNLLLGSVAVLGLCALIILALAPRMGDAERASGRLTEEMSGSAVRLLLDSSHLRTIAWILGLTIVVGTLVDWQFNRAVELFVEGEDAKTEFFGLFFAVLNVVSITVQLLLTGLVLRRFGLRVALLVLPVGLAVASVGILAIPGLVAVTVAKGAEGSLRYSLDQATRELLFLPVPEHVKYKVKPLIDLGIYRGGTGVGGLLLLLFVNGLDFSIRAVSVVVLVAVAAWIVAALRMRREFGDSLKRLIGVRDVRLEELVVGHLNAETRRELKETLRTGSPEQIAYALSLLDVDRSGPWPENLESAVAELLDHESAEVRGRALEMLTDRGVEGLEEEVAPLLDDPELEVRTRAVRYLCAHGSEDPVRAMERFLDSDAEPLRTAAVGCMLRDGGPDQRRRAMETVRSLAASDQPESRRMAARLLGQLRELDDEARELLAGLVRDPEVAVCRQAMEAAGRSCSDQLVPVLLDRLRGPGYRGAALAALEAYGPRIHDTLLDRLTAEDTPPDVRAILPRLLVPDAGQDTMERMFEVLPRLEPTGRYEILKSLNKLRRQRSDLDFAELDMEPRVREEARLAHLHTVRLTARDGADGGLLARTLRQRRREAVERAFRTLGLQMPQEDLYAAFAALTSSEELTRQQGFELLDTVLPQRYRTWFDPLINPDADLDSRVEAARKRFDVAVPDPDELLAELAGGDDPWLALLTHRELGHHEMPEHLTAAQLEARMRAESLLADRTCLPCEEKKMMRIVERAEVLGNARIFEGLRTEDVAGIAALAREQSFEEGRVVFGEGEPGRSLHLVVEGMLEARKGGRTLFTAGPGGAVGSLSLLDGLPTDYEVVACQPTTVLTLGREEFGRILAERHDVVEGVIRYLTGVVRGLNEEPEA